jgi:hypothetical protein
MKTVHFILPVLFAFGTLLRAQEKNIEFDLANKYTPVEVIPGVGDEFYLLCQQRVYKNVVGNALFKFDKDLKTVWKEPLVIKSSMMKGDYLGTLVQVFSTPATVSGKAAEFLIKNEDYFQIMDDGTSEKIEWDVPERELRKKLAAHFADGNGLNLLTMVGDETFPTGKLNWYTFSPEGKKQTKRSFQLPVPPQIDEDNESGWRLNDVTDEGLYFYYVSYKNKVKDQSRPILACHAIHVGKDGKPGKIASMDLGLKDYNVLHTDFQQSWFSNLTVFKPDMYDSGVQGTSHIPSDNAYLGVKIDGKSGRIYLVAAQNDEIEVSKDGTIKSGALGQAKPVKSLALYVYDLAGNPLAQTKLPYAAAKLAATDDYTYAATSVEINPFDGEEGVLVKIVNNGSGCFWRVNPKGEVAETVKFKLANGKVGPAKIYMDLFAARYDSLADFNKSPYSTGEGSAVVQFLDKVPADKKVGAGYLLLDNMELVAIWNDKENTMKLNSFAKN